MQRHLRYHLERLTLFTLPSLDVDWEEGATGESSDSHQAIQGRGRQASLERDFDDGSDLSSLPSGSDPGVGVNNQVLLETLHQYAPPEPDGSAPIRRWIDMLAMEPDDLDGIVASASGGRDTSDESQQLARKQETQLHGKLSLCMPEYERETAILTTF